MKTYRSEKAGREILRTYDLLLEQWGVDKEERDISGTYGTTHCILCGSESSPPLVLFHGVGDDSALMWLYNAKALAEKFRLYVIDTIGGPGRSRFNERYGKDFDDLIWLDEVIGALSLGAVSIVGVSHGAHLAQFYAANRPERVRKIVCIAGSVPVGDESPMKTMMKIFLPEALFPTKKNTAKLLRKLCGKHVGVFLENETVMAHYGALLRGFNNMAMRFHQVTGLPEEQIDAIRGKTLYLIGEEDPFAKLGGKDALLRCKMNAQFFPNAGHAINHELAPEINRQIITYLQA